MARDFVLKFSGSRYKEIPERSRRKILQYDDILAQTDKILYWFSQKHLSALFYKLFEDKVNGIHGGIEWIIWSLDEMVRDLVETDPQTFCMAPKQTHYLTLQTKIQRVAAYQAAKAGTLYGIDDSGIYVLGRNWTQILKEQNHFVKEKCKEH